MTAPAIAVVGVVGGEVFGTRAAAAIAAADVIVGAHRHLDAVATPATAENIVLAGPLALLIERIAAARAASRRVCVLASGDPGFFGIVRALGNGVGADALEVHPAPSSVALAFARVGLSWDDAAVVSAHGRPLAEAVRRVLGAQKVAVLTAPDQPPEALGRALLAAGSVPRDVVVASRLGELDERVTRTDLAGLAAGTFDGLSVVLILGTEDERASANLAWGLPVAAFAHRNGMITKPEVRAIVLSKLALPRTGVLWDLGAGSGSVGIEAARLSSGLAIVLVERDEDSCARIRENAAAHGVADRCTVICGRAPDVLEALPAPDRVFVGGGGLDVLDAALDRMADGGVAVATYAIVDRATAAAARLGSMVQLQVSTAVSTGDAGLRLSADNPVFVCWTTPS